MKISSRYEAACSRQSMIVIHNQCDTPLLPVWHALCFGNGQSRFGDPVNPIEQDRHYY
jgi:hypothetical protein